VQTNTCIVVCTGNKTRTQRKKADMQFEGLHHITAITGDAAQNVDFYTRVVGLRLVAKTVNQDDTRVYHLFYGDEHAQPGADLTFFEYPHAVPGRAGAGMVYRVVWRVASAEALDFWAGRLASLGVEAERTADSVVFADPEGLQHELVVNVSPDAALIADHPDIPAAVALQGFEGVRAYAGAPEQSAALLEGLMGAVRREDAAYELRGSHRGGWIALDPAPELPGRQSAGTIHHIAWGTTDAEQPRWVQTLNEAGIQHSGIIDRNYFHSVYFREPGGVLFELATEEPGFTVDGPVEELGTKIILPPWLEPRREQIVANLTPLPDPRADWVKN
jgi:glyoxalase family protein